jgi:antitoxin component YwqK of YwqJK toxin-antitoxin module
MTHFSDTEFRDMRRHHWPLSLIVLAKGAIAVQDCDLNGQAVNPANGYTTEGKTGLMRCRDRDNGQVVREEELKAGKFVGLVRHYKGGWVEKEYSVNEKGNRDGRAREFYAEGKVAREEIYRNGSVVGTSRSWYPNGALKRISVRGDDEREKAYAEFNDRGQLRDLRCADRPVMGKDVDDAALCGHGAREPVTRELYSDKGSVRGRVSHLAGQRVGSELLWDNGKPQEQQEIGKGTWVERSFSREGVKRRETRWIAVDNGRVKQSEQEFHESGSLVRERRWEAGELASEKTWFLNGQLKTDDRYARREGRGVCDATEFYDNGKQRRWGTYLVRNGYLNGPIGSHRGFDIEGRLRSESEYDGNGRLTRERELDETGRVVRDDAMFEDGSRKAFAAPAR